MERLGEGLKKLALAGIGTAAYAVEKSADILDTLAKKGEETVEQGKVLNKELKHNVKSTIKDYKASNGKMHTVHEAEVVEAEVVEDDDIPGSATEVEDVDDHEKTETEEAEAETEETAVETAPEEAEDDAFDGESEDDTTDEN